jgi:hypothetical protein
MSMNLRHAAALALVGWYLMVPPTTHEILDIKAPLSQWVYEGAFDKADDCESARANGATSKGGPGTSEQEIQSIRQMFARGQCVASDDCRRLKEK